MELMESAAEKGTTRTSSGNERGFSLIELVIVLLIVVVAGSLVMPSLDKGFDSLRARRAALGIAATARSLRTRSLKEQLPFRLVVSAKDGSYRVFGQDPVFLPEGVHVAIAGGELVGEGVSHFLFFPNGRMVGGDILVSSEDHGAGYLVRLDTVSAKVKVSRSRGS